MMDRYRGSLNRTNCSLNVRVLTQNLRTQSAECTHCTLHTAQCTVTEVSGYQWAKLIAVWSHRINPRAKPQNVKHRNLHSSFVYIYKFHSRHRSALYCNITLYNTYPFRSTISKFATAAAAAAQPIRIAEYSECTLGFANAHSCNTLGQKGGIM